MPVRRWWHDAAVNQRLSKSARTRERILDSAARVFRQRGYSNARLSDIAEAADIRTGSLYYHFASREELVGEILRLGVETAWQQVVAAVDALPPSASPMDRIAVAIRAHTRAVLELDDYAAAEARIVGQVPPPIASAHRKHRRAYGAYWNELLVAARDAGQLAPDLDLFTARMLCLGAMNWTVEWIDEARRPPVDEVADQAVALLVRGLTAPPLPPARRSPRRSARRPVR